MGLSSLECWQGTVSTTDSKTFKIVNSDEDISSGGTLELHTLWHFSSKPQLIAAFLDGSDVCGGGSVNPTTTTTTTTTTGPPQPHLAYLLVPQLPPYQQPRLIMATSQIIHQNMIMVLSLRNLYSSMRLRDQDLFLLTIEYLGDRTVLWMMRYLVVGTMQEILSNSISQWPQPSPSLPGVVSTS